MVKIKGVVSAKRLFRKKRKKKKDGDPDDSQSSYTASGVSTGSATSTKTSNASTMTTSNAVSDTTTDPEERKLYTEYKGKLDEIQQQHQSQINRLRASYETRIGEMTKNHRKATEIFLDMNDSKQQRLNTVVQKMKDAKRMLQKKYVVLRMQHLAVQQRHARDKQKQGEAMQSEAEEWKNKFLALKSSHELLLQDAGSYFADSDSSQSIRTPIPRSPPLDDSVIEIDTNQPTSANSDLEALRFECDALKEERKRSWRKWYELNDQLKSKQEQNLKLKKSLDEIRRREKIHKYGYDQVRDVITNLTERIDTLEGENKELKSKTAKRTTELKFWRNLRKYDKEQWKRHMVLTKSLVIKTLQLHTLRTSTDAAINDLEQCVMELNGSLLETTRNREDLERRIEILMKNKFENILSVNGNSPSVCYEDFKREIRKYQDTKIQIDNMANGMERVMLDTGVQFEKFGHQMQAMRDEYESQKVQFQRQMNGMQYALRDASQIYGNVYHQFAPFLLKVQEPPFDLDPSCESKSRGS